MKSFRYWPLVGTAVATVLYLVASDYLFPIKNEREQSSFDLGNSKELIAECVALKKGMLLDSLSVVLRSHNRHSLMSDKKGGRAIFWVSSGEAGKYYPVGPACVVDVDLGGQVVSWKVEDF